MIDKRFPAHLWILFISATLLIISSGLYYYDHQLTDQVVTEKVVGQLEDDFQALCLEMDARFPNMLESEFLIHLIYNSDSTLVFWSESEHAPPAQFHDELIRKENGSSFQAGNKKYYLLKHIKDSQILISLILLEVKYKVKNDYLPSMVWLGRYQSSKGWVPKPDDVQLSISSFDSGYEIRGPNQQVAFKVNFSDINEFRFPVRRSFLFLLLGGLLACFFTVYLYARQRKGLQHALAFSFLFILVVRILFFILNFPANYIPLKLFSPQLLAINSWNTSLGDFTWNCGLVLMLSVVLSKMLFRKISTLYLKTDNHAVLSWFLFLLSIFLCTASLSFYFVFLDSVFINSNINIDFTDIFKLDWISYLLFLDLGALLCAVLILNHQFLRYILHFINKSRLPYFSLIILFIALSFLISFAISQGNAFSAVVILIALGLTFIFKSRLKSWEFFRMSFINLLVISFTFSLLSSYAVLRGLQLKKRQKMETLIHKASEERDLVTESLFDRAVGKILDQRLVLQAGLIEDEVLADINSWLVEEFFKDSFKGYNLDIYIFDEVGNRIDKSYSKHPRIRMNHLQGLKKIGEKTISPNLVWIPDNEKNKQHLYLGLVDLEFKELGKVYIQVELSPTQYAQNRLYPRLLVDDHLKDDVFPDSDYDMAVYWKGNLQSKTSAYPFSLRANELSELPVKYLKESIVEGEISMFLRPEMDKIVHVRSVFPGIVDMINIFSFAFYYYLFVFFLVYLPYLIWFYVNRPGEWRNMSLRTKIQFFLIFITVVPLLIITFALSPFIKERFYQDVREDLLSETRRIASLIAEDYVALTQNQLKGPVYLPFRDKMAQIEENVYRDINIFDDKGRIRFTTQQVILSMGMTSGLINPEAFRAILSGNQSEIVVDEEIGKLQYLSAYYPLYSSNKKMVGVLNIPYLTQQDRVNEQVMSLLSFLIDIYMLVFLVVGILGLLLTDSIIRPLTLLKEKLDKTRLGNYNEPIKWGSKDEIGKILTSYNQMLEKLAENEKEISNSQRKLAWKQMARQVAHEIKNPLTPMKLSVQHLTRAWMAKAPNLDKMFEKVTQTLLVQIDSLVNIANSFSEFAQMPEAQKDLLNLPEVLRSVLHLYEHSEGVQWEIHIPKSEFIVNSDKDQLSRVFGNLIKNAIQAIERPDKQIKITLKTEKGWAKIQIQDNGKGIEDDLRDKIFQPNFSTKTSGMGLGLAIVRQIIENSGGKIYFESKLGVGTTFYVELPEAV